MRVLILHTRYRDRGGEDAAVDDQCRILESRNHDVSLLLAHNSGGLAGASALARSLWNGHEAARVESEIRRFAPDVVHVHNTWFAMSASVVSRASKCGIPVVATLHNFRLACANGLLLRDGHPCQDCVGASSVHAVRHRCYRGLAGSSLAAANIELHAQLGTWTRHVFEFLTMSEFASAIHGRHGIPHDRMSVAPQTASDPGARPEPPSMSSDVLYVGRLSDEKGVVELVREWGRVRDLGLRLRVIGDGPLRSRLLRAAPETDVTLLGSLSPEAVRAEMLKARALVVPSICYEGQPLVAVEAMSAGLPVWGSGHGGLGELVSKIDSRCAVDPTDPSAWRDAFAEIRVDSVVDEIGEAARSSYELGHRPANLARCLEDVYSRAVSSGAESS